MGLSHKKKEGPSDVQGPLLDYSSCRMRILGIRFFVVGIIAISWARSCMDLRSARPDGH